MTGEVVDTLVIGAGISGLGAAVELLATGRRVRVLDAGERPGGVIRTDRRDGFLLERGPNAFRVPPPLYAWLQRHDLDRILIPAGSEARMRALFLDGRLLWLPESLPGALTTPLLSTRAKLRAAGEMFRAREERPDETVSEFITRRFGGELLERAVAPFLTGVYAGDEDQLGAEAVFPQLVAWERSQGSVLRGGLRHALHRNRPRGLPGSHSTATGVAGFAEALVEKVGDALQGNVRVKELVRENGVVVARGEDSEWRARNVVVALPAREAGALLAPSDPTLRPLFEQIVYAPMASLALSVDPKRSREPIRGFGFLVPREARLRLLGGLFPARVFPGRAPAGRELVMAMIGGTRWPGVTDASDDALLEAVIEGLDRTLGAEISDAPLAVRRWPRAVPQPGPSHPAQIRALRAAVVHAWPSVRLAGSYLDGVSVGDALLSGVRAARSIAPAEPVAEPS